MKKTFKNYITLFLSVFYLSAFTFGGGYVIIPLMKKRFVDKLGWLKEDEMLDIAAIAQSSPGAMAVNAAILIGGRVLGVLGAAVSIIGTILPPLIILSVISLIYSAFRDNLIVVAVLKGMMAGVCAVICDVVITMLQKLVKQQKILPVIILLGVFIIKTAFNINAIYIIVFCGALGAMLSVRAKKTGRDLL